MNCPSQAELTQMVVGVFVGPPLPILARHRTKETVGRLEGVGLLAGNSQKSGNGALTIGRENRRLGTLRWDQAHEVAR